MIAQLIERIENARISLGEAAAAFLGVVLVRFFFEDLSSPPISFPAVIDAPTMLHYLLFYFGVILSLALVINIFVRNIGKVSKFLLFGFPVIWLSPIFDLIVSRGAGYRMTYIFTNSQSLWPKSSENAGYRFADRRDQ